MQGGPLMLLHFPVPRAQLGNARGRVILQTAQRIGEPVFGTDVTELDGLDQRVDRRGAPSLEPSKV